MQLGHTGLYLVTVTEMHNLGAKMFQHDGCKMMRLCTSCKIHKLISILVNVHHQLVLLQLGCTCRCSLIVMWMHKLGAAEVPFTQCSCRTPPDEQLHQQILMIDHVRHQVFFRERSSSLRLSAG